MSRRGIEEKALPEGWREMRLGDFCQVRRGGSPRPIQDYITTSEEGINWLRIGDVPPESKYIFKTNGKIKPEGLKKSVLVKEGDFILSNSMSYGRPYIMKVESCIHDGWLTLCDIKKTVHKEYLYYSLLTDKIQNTFKSVSAGTGVRNLKKESVSSIYIMLPPLSEQKAIASLLEAWDTTIEKTEALIAAKEKRFKWLVESSINKYQYSDIWGEYTLGDLFDFHTCPSKSKLIDETGEQVIIDMGSISRNGDLITTKRTHSVGDFLLVNDLVMPKDDIGGGNIIGKVAIIESTKKYVCGDHVYRMVPKPKTDAPFLRFLINCPAINKRLRACANGTAQLGLGKRDVVKQKVWLPPLDKQKKIWCMLSVAKNEIFLLQRLVEKYRTQKRGLMQKMLTGKWRITEESA